VVEWLTYRFLDLLSQVQIQAVPLDTYSKQS